jgi:hypothetical protein
MKHVLAALLLTAVSAFAQGANTAVSGVVTDPTGAAVPGAAVTVFNTNTSITINTATNDRGEYTVPALPAGAYRVTVAKAGFKSSTIENVNLSVGVPGTVNVKLEVGQASETVEVTAGAEIVQAQTADVSTTITGRQLTDLPFATRNAVELLVDAPGTQTPTNPRSSSVNGLPKGAINITIDGMNTQDNMLKSSDGYFSYIMPSIDSLSEVTMTSTASGVDTTGEGGVQIRFVTKSGTNQWHGGGFWQTRNTFFNSNYFFNNQQGLPRDIMRLNQEGGHIGGPILKNRLFFFGNVEVYRYPGTNGYSRTYLTPSASSGIFTYADSANVTHSVNVLSLAAAANASLPSGVRPFTTALDPTFAKTFALMQTAGANGIVKNNAPTDYNTLTTSYQPTGLDARDFFTSRIDFNITQKHVLSFVYNYDWYQSVPDFLNNIVPDFPGTGSVLFSNVNTGQGSNRFDGTFSLRSVIGSNFTNEARAGLNGGTVVFFGAISPGLFTPWNGYVPSFASVTSGLSGVTTTSSPQRRNAPVKNVGDTVTYVHGAHQMSFGGTFDQINLFQQIEGSSIFPRVSLGIASGDPVNTGATNIFTSGNFPGASSSQMSAAAGLYANITGRVSSITTQEVLSEASHNYQLGLAPIDRDRMREIGLFFQDQWRVKPNLTMTLGFRAEKQFAFQNLNGLYSQVTYPNIWGVSGVGNLFKPGTLAGTTPTYTQLGDNAYTTPLVPAPSVGLAWQIHPAEGFLRIFTGGHEGAAVLRGGYAIATVREGMGVYQSLYGSNLGLTQDASVSNSTFPSIFGPAGSVNFSDPSLPSRVSSLPTTLSFPIAANFTSSMNAISPHLKIGYAQSWNISYQREIDRHTVVDIRYTGNHGTDLWRQLNLNEANIFENGFLSEFQIAQQNLTIQRGGNIANPNSNNNANYNNFGNLGLPGQRNTPILQTALGTTNDSTTATQLQNGQAGSTANGIAGNASRMALLTAAGYPSNFFFVNPTVGGGGAFVLTNDGATFYDALQVEVRRTMTQGFSLQGSYVFAKSLTRGATASSSDSSNPNTLRNEALDKGPSGFDIRNAIKFNWIYELPFGPGKHWAPGNAIAKRVVGGWQISGVARLQSGTPLGLSSYATFNQYSSGVVLHNITMKQLQSMVGIYKSNLQSSTNAVNSIVYWLPPPTNEPTTISKTTGLPSPTVSGITSANNVNLITNTQAAFAVNNLLQTNVNPNAPYIGPAAAGQAGCLCYLYLPWQRHLDLEITKNTRINEKVTLQIAASFLNALNMTNFFPGANTTSTTFGYVTSAYRDISGTVDPGGRIIEFRARLNF